MKIIFASVVLLLFTQFAFGGRCTRDFWNYHWPEHCHQSEQQVEVEAVGDEALADVKLKDLECSFNGAACKEADLAPIEPGELSEQQLAWMCMRGHHPKHCNTNGRSIEIEPIEGEQQVASKCHTLVVGNTCGKLMPKASIDEIELDGQQVADVGTTVCHRKDHGRFSGQHCHVTHPNAQQEIEGGQQVADAYCHNKDHPGGGLKGNHCHPFAQKIDVGDGVLAAIDAKTSTGPTDGMPAPIDQALAKGGGCNAWDETGKCISNAFKKPPWKRKADEIEPINLQNAVAGAKCNPVGNRKQRAACPGNPLKEVNIEPIGAQTLAAGGCVAHPAKNNGACFNKGPRQKIEIENGDDAFTSDGVNFAQITSRNTCPFKDELGPDCNMAQLQLTDEYEKLLSADTSIPLVERLFALLTFSSIAYASEVPHNHENLHIGSHVHDAAGHHWGYVAEIFGHLVRVVYTQEYSEWVKTHDKSAPAEVVKTR